MFAQQWLDLFVMFTMELSAVLHSVQVLTCVLKPILFIFFISSWFSKIFIYQSLHPIMRELGFSLLDFSN